MRKLREIGPVEMVREGANHTVVSVNGNRFTVPRHREIGEQLAAEILKQAKGRRKR